MDAAARFPHGCGAFWGTQVMRRGIYLSGILAVSLVATALFASPASAQIVVGRGGGVSISVPGLGGIRLGAPLRMRGVIVAPYGNPYGYRGYGSIDYAPRYGGVTRYAARRVSQAPPTAGELGAMNDSDLLNAVVGLRAQLDADLERFDTASTWQSYLGLPEDALPPASDDGRVALGVASLSETLKRFQLTEANPRYVQISGLPSFASMHVALDELVSRLGSALTAEVDASPAVAADAGVRPPPVPTPPALSSITASSRDYAPQSIEMRNLHARPASGSVSSGVDADASVATEKPGANRVSEELPTPPPSLVAPRNEAEERSVLNR
jgi:hypothetical protein